MRKFYVRLTGVCVVLLLISMTGAPAQAGGWVVITLEELPDELQVDVPVEIGFAVRQHGRTLITLWDGPPRIEATHVVSGETISVAAEAGFTGYYRATVTFPQAGRWQWHIDPHPFPTVATMPDFMVAGASPASGVAMAGDIDTSHPFWQWWHWVQQWLLTVQLTTDTELSMQDGEVVTSANSMPTWGADSDAVSRGRALFLAKGCASCHLHEEVVVAWSTQEGPNLTDYAKTIQFLELWLADPADVNPKTTMPSLGLDAKEIAALAAFLHADGE